MTKLVRVETDAERQGVVAEIERTLEGASRPERHAALREFVEATVFRSATNSFDVGGDGRAARALPMLLEALDLDQMELLMALLPSLQNRDYPEIRAQAFMMLEQAGVFDVEPAEGADARFPVIMKAVSTGALEADRAPLGSMYTLDPEAAVFTWFDLDPESYGKDPAYRRWLVQEILRMQQIRREVEEGYPPLDPSAANTRRGLNLLYDLADEPSWPVQKYVHTVLVYSNNFDDPRIAERLGTTAVPKLSYLRAKDFDPILFPEQVIGGLPAQLGPTTAPAPAD